MDARRIVPPGEFETLLTRLCDSSPLGLGIFETKQKALMFAAALGHYRKRSETLTRRGEGIRVDVFQREEDDTFIDALAVAAGGDLRLLGSERTEERLRIFEEYAHGGLLEIQRIVDAEGNVLEELIRITQEAEPAGAAEIPGVDASVLALMR